MATVHQRIMRAAAANRGIRLTAAEVESLARDGAVEQCATNDDEKDAGRPPPRTVPRWRG
jgi:hypothetical protein